jgi:hypothetical protein
MAGRQPFSTPIALVEGGRGASHKTGLPSETAGGQGKDR